MGDLMTVQEVAERCRVDKKTVYRWIANGVIRAKRLPGGGLRIRSSSMIPDQVWSVPEAAEHYRVSAQTIRAWIRKGALLVVKLPDGSFRVKRGQ